MPDLQQLRVTLQTRFPLVGIETVEEPKALALVRRLADEEGQDFYTWSVADGLVHQNFRYGGRRQGDWQTVEGYRSTRDDNTGQAQGVEGTESLQAALQHIDKGGKPGLYVLLDAHPWLEEAPVVRLLRELALNHLDSRRTVVLISPRLSLPNDLARHAAMLSLAVPDMKKVREIFRDEIELYARSPEGKRVAGEQTVVEQLVQHVLGLCEEDVRRMLRMAIRDDGAITREDLLRVVKLKRQMFATAALEIELETMNLDSVGGMVNLKRWLALRKGPFSRPVPGLPAPRGVLLLGVQGGGKSLAARTISASWGVPLVHLDVGSLLNKWQGESERNLRDALAAAEAMAPCVLWVDEIEKALASSSGESDGGLMRRMLGSLLTWMAEREGRVFLAATANDVRRLPPELLRKGRFDEIFFVDLPDAAARRAIFHIHLTRRGLDPAQFSPDALCAASEGFTGAEIEQAVVASLYEAHHQERPVDQAMLLAELARTRPLSVLMAEDVAELRSWARERAVPA